MGEYIGIGLGAHGFVKSSNSTIDDTTSYHNLEGSEEEKVDKMSSDI
jgi:coproporphyrinogen III oxidase-like Fe-S oxidoreductase